MLCVVKFTQIRVNRCRWSGNAEKLATSKIPAFEAKSIQTHKNPLKNLKTAKTQKLFVNVDSKVQKNAMNKVGCITFRLPFVSARNPHKWELDMMPEQIEIHQKSSSRLSENTHQRSLRRSECPCLRLSISYRTATRAAQSWCPTSPSEQSSAQDRSGRWQHNWIFRSPSAPRRRQSWSVSVDSSQPFLECVAILETFPFSLQTKIPSDFIRLWIRLLALTTIFHVRARFCCLTHFRKFLKIFHNFCR